VDQHRIHTRIPINEATHDIPYHRSLWYHCQVDKRATHPYQQLLRKAGVRAKADIRNGYTPGRKMSPSVSTEDQALYILERATELLSKEANLVK
ncbi:hypothetical protein H0H92_015072, partial [Tricholoma furcatifolium]